MRDVLRLILACLALIALARAALFEGAAVCTWLLPLQAYHLEGQMIHLAWRAEQGQALYPDWHSYPHVLNVFGPLYFLAVGWVGRWQGADLDGLARIGRGLSILAGLGASVLVGVASGRREGPRAGLFAASMAVGAVPMIGFGVMVRADLTADLLGFAGFLTATGGRSRWRVVLGTCLLVASIFTKQTMGLYLVAAFVALWLDGRRGAALALAVVGSFAIVGIVAAVTSTIEPNFARDLLGAAETPVSLPDWALTLQRLLTQSPEIPALSALGLLLWLRRRTPDLPLATLSAVLLGGSILLASKSGSDLNYFLGPRLVAALASGALWGMAERSIRDRSRTGLGLSLAFAMTLGLLLWPSTRHVGARFQGAWQTQRFLSNAGREVLRQHRRLDRIAEDPEIAMLTDDGMLAMHQGIRAPFVDPWLFRILVVHGKIEPIEIRRKLEGAEYDLLVTTHDLLAPTYLTYTFGLPPVLIEPARRNYVPQGMMAGMYLYSPRDGVREAEPAAPGRVPRPGPG